MKIAYVTTFELTRYSKPPKNHVGIWGAAHYISKNLESQSIGLNYISPLKKKFTLITKIKWSFYRYLFKKDYYGWSEPLVVRDYATQISKKISGINADIVLCTENALPVAYLNCEQPIVLWIDTTLAGLIDFYPYLSNLCNNTRNNIYILEKYALDRCNLIIFSSDWAAQTAIKLYGMNPSKVQVVPWGANIECNRTKDDIYKILESRISRPCKLLFVGVDWLRKGGNIALDVTKQLNQMGLNTTLTVVGCKPTLNEPLPNFVEVQGFIDKSTQAGLNKLNKLMTESHFLILPTLADCSPHVLIEANSFGVPCLASDVGGIKTIIKEKVNGRTFSIDASVSNYCDYIVSIMEDYTDYKKLAMSAFDEYQSRLNWASVSQSVKQLLINLVS
ncbi:glycosyltransferase [Coleofasciculus sp. FACHB-64]|uniref:glycosyltransferase family 4 protein n=1 Tax=Cyanophyceae TaxID=3028117 RepID=UPI0016899CB0|nr:MULTISPECIES: glycosyltransferase family 4 protein [unclassified Coleofasciculus]MBD1837611.1 glycosyltransferase [Coleofasciculus sp. FACHB-501]MBD2048176.1 glycosyltransferase [Coleofasciculus sp. FACHB-64]